MAIYGAVEAGSSVLAQAYRRLDKLKILTAIPLLAWLRTLPSARLSLADHEVSVRAVESWVVRRMIAGANTRGYNAAFLAVLQKAQAAAREPAGDVATAVVHALNDSPNSLAWPDDAGIGQAFATTTYYGNFTQERIRLLLGSIDAQMRVENKKTETAVFDYETLQIEHLMPRAWAEHWPLPNDACLGEADRALAAAERHAVVHRIGNLTLVTPTFNQAVSNGAWTLKRPELSAQSALQLNGPVASQHTWDEATIAARASDLAAMACRVWPHAAALRPGHADHDATANTPGDST